MTLLTCFREVHKNRPNLIIENYRLYSYVLVLLPYTLITN